jgi:hypothetical protein
MKATVLRLYMHESRRFHGMLLYEWLLEHARKLGVHGGSAFRAVAGYDVPPGEALGAPAAPGSAGAPELLGVLVAEYSAGQQT